MTPKSTQTEIFIVRPYVQLANEAAGVDRYASLITHLLQLGVRANLLCSTFHHTSKKRRDASPIISRQGIIAIECGTYKNNVSVFRIWFEVRFTLAVLRLVWKHRPRKVLVGEPLFLAAWLLKAVQPLRRFTLLGDVIDLLPEAYAVKFQDATMFRHISFPIRKLRDLKINLCYDSVAFVSESYKRIVSPKSSNAKVIYWGSAGVEKTATISQGRSYPPILLYCGALGDGYDIGMLIEIGKRRRDVRVVIAGDGPNRQACVDAHARGIIEYRGLIGRSDLRKLLMEATVGVLPYKQHSAVAMPVKFYEYIDYSLIVLNSLELECASIIAEHEIGANYIAENVDSCLEGLEKCLSLKVNPRAYVELQRRFDKAETMSGFAKLLKI